MVPPTHPGDRVSKIRLWPTLLIGGGALLLVKAAFAAQDARIRPLTDAETERESRLIPAVREALYALRRALARAGIQTFVGQTWHSAEQAERGFLEGRSATRQSWHMTGRAVDIYVIDPATGKPDVHANRMDLYERMGALARKLGWRWLGTGVIVNPETGATFRDPYHLEYRQGLTYAQALEQYAQTGLAAVPWWLIALPGVP